MSRLQLVTDPTEHQFKERDGELPGAADARCRHCGEGVELHIARQCAAGVSHMMPRCEADSTWVVLWRGRRVPFCLPCMLRVLDAAIMVGVGLTAEPIAARGVA